MTPARATLTVAVIFLALAFSARAEPEADSGPEISSGIMSYRASSDIYDLTNHVIVRWQGAVLSADHVTVNLRTGEAVAEGHVRIQREDQTWIGEHIQYNFKTRQMNAARFRTGRAPVFAGGRGLHGVIRNEGGTLTNAPPDIYTATNALVTMDDISNPFIKVRAHRIRIVPGKYIEASHAVLWVGDVPAMYFPYYRRNLGRRSNNLNFAPGYRSAFGPFLLSDYSWFLNPELDGAVHVDYRQKRGVGTGPDVNFHLGRWGEGTARYYYAHDEDAGTNLAGVHLPEDRQRVYFSYLAEPFTNLTLRSMARYQNDSDIVKDFFEGEYRQNPQPNTYFNANKFWENFSLDALAQPRVNDYLETVERLPQVKLTGFRQELGDSPIYYESESSAGYYRRRFAGTNSPFPSSTNTLFDTAGGIPPDFSAKRADTYQQLTLPETLFGWLNVAPRVGGRLTYYSPVDVAGPGTSFRTNSDTYRAIFNTGAEISFKASRLWPGVSSKALDLDGLRHIVEPSMDYVYVSKPNYPPNELPQFDYEQPSLYLIPIDFPEYNSIDSIDNQNVIRFGLRNRLQTKRLGQVRDVLNWNLMTDWRLRPRSDQKTFADLYSDLTLRPRRWITFRSETRLDLNTGRWRMALHTLTFEPSDVWSWTIGHFYLRDDFSPSPTALGPGNNLITSTLYYRLNDNWGLRASHHFDAQSGRMEEQYYTIYRDMRSWTGALTVGLLDNGNGPKDFRIAFTFSLKAMPKYGLGRDTVGPYSLLGVQ